MNSIYNWIKGENMNKLKTIIFASVLLLGTNANATSVDEIAVELVKQKDMVVNHISVQVDKTKEYQINAWADGKEQLKNNWIMIKSWFKVEPKDKDTE